MTITNMLSRYDEPIRRSSMRPISAHTNLMIAMLLGGAISATTEAAVIPEFGAAAGQQWTTAGGTLQGTRFSSLNQINTNNVKGLKEEFSLKTEVSGRFMGEPLVVGRMLFAVTGFPNRLIAYDLGNKGAIKWTYAPSVNEYSKGANCCGGINRGAAYAEAFADENGVLQPPRVVFNLLDNTVVAINANTGKLIWKNNLADPHTGITMTVAPIITPTKTAAGSVVGGKVITASSSGEMGVRGWIQALDLKTGLHLWRAYNTGSDKDVMITGNTKNFYPKDQGKDLGLKSWPNERAALLGGSSAWAYLTYDPDLNLLFYGTSQPGVWNADMRPGANKWGSAIFARNPDNGEAKWIYQVVEHDSWDYDAGSENIAVDMKLKPTDQNARKLLIHLNKNGFAYTFDRGTGEILTAKQFANNVNWATADKFDLITGTQAVRDDMRIHQDKEPKRICPSVLGGKGWEPGAFSPKTQAFYMPTFNFCSTMDALKAEFISGAPYMGASYDITPDLSTGLPFKSSELIAWDAIKGERKWTVSEPAMIYAGVLATAGDVVFYTTQAPSFKAINANTGAALWNTPLTCNVVGNPISFQGPDGKQRVAVFSDDSCANGKALVSGGGRVHVYKLP